MRLAHGIIQTPPNINHPARVAERIAVLDLIGNGRCEFGMGSGATTTELGGFNVSQQEKKAMQIEGFRVAVRMMVENPFTGFEGQYVKVPRATSCQNRYRSRIRRFGWRVPGVNRFWKRRG